jgi:hypothetical protein
MATSRILPISILEASNTTNTVTFNYVIEIQNDPPPGETYPVAANVSFSAYDSASPNPNYVTPSAQPVQVTTEISSKHWDSAQQSVTVDCSTFTANPCYLVISPTDVNDESIPASIQFNAPNITRPLPCPVCSPTVVEVHIRITGGSVVIDCDKK